MRLCGYEVQVFTCHCATAAFFSLLLVHFTLNKDESFWFHATRRCGVSGRINVTKMTDNVRLVLMRVDSNVRRIALCRIDSLRPTAGSLEEPRHRRHQQVFPSIPLRQKNDTIEKDC